VGHDQGTNTQVSSDSRQAGWLAGTFQPSWNTVMACLGCFTVPRCRMCCVSAIARKRCGHACRKPLGTLCILPDASPAALLTVSHCWFWGAPEVLHLNLDTHKGWAPAWTCSTGHDQTVGLQFSMTNSCSASKWVVVQHQELMQYQYSSYPVRAHGKGQRYAVMYFMWLLRVDNLQLATTHQ
jgi:hypothetical protein